MIRSGRISASTMLHVVRRYVCRQQAPAAVGAMLPQSCQYHGPAGRVEDIQLLEHASTFRRDTLRIRIEQPAADQVVAPVHRSLFIAVKASAITGECNQIPHGPLPYITVAAR